MIFSWKNVSWCVIAFDQVEDGAGNLESAKRIFGENYEAFHYVNGNDQVKDSICYSGQVHQHGPRRKVRQCNFGGGDAPFYFFADPFAKGVYNG